MIKPRVVLDTNVIVSALLFPEGDSATIYKQFVVQRLSLIYNMAIILEYQDVLRRPCFQFSLTDIEVLTADIQQYGVICAPFPSSDDLFDEDARLFYYTAKSVNALLITDNKMHFPREPFIITPSEYLTYYTTRIIERGLFMV